MIRSNILLRWLNVQESFTHQWLMIYPNDHNKILELINIKKQQFSLQGLNMDQDQASKGSSGGGRGTIKGLRAKNDLNIKNKGKPNKSPFSTKLGSR